LSTVGGSMISTASIFGPFTRSKASISGAFTISAGVPVAISGRRHDGKDVHLRRLHNVRRCPSQEVSRSRPASPSQHYTTSGGLTMSILGGFPTSAATSSTRRPI
jgi:hypothetical protein